MSNFNIEYNTNKHLTIITPKYYNAHPNKLIKITTSEYDVKQHILVSSSYDDICPFCCSNDKTIAITNDGGSLSHCSSCNLHFNPPKILYVKFRESYNS